MYLLQGKLIAQEGHRKRLAEILIQASQLIASAKGCRLYLVGKDENEKHSVFVTEVWDTKEDHDNSLNVEGVKELIMKAMPILAYPPSKGHELEVIGGYGI